MKKAQQIETLAMLMYENRGGRSCRYRWHGPWCGERVKNFWRKRAKAVLSQFDVRRKHVKPK